MRYISFLKQASGSLSNLETQSRTWRNKGYLKGREYRLIQDRIRQTQGMLSVLVRTLTDSN